MTNLHLEIFDNNHALELLSLIQRHDNFSDFYLAGGTALALFLGHRKSIDLDFFSATEFSANQVQLLGKSFDALSINKNAIEVIIDGVKVMFMYFAFARKQDLVVVNNFRLASPIDIGLMKLLAIQGRTTKKDIIDLYFIDKEIIPLSELLVMFEKHYPQESFNAYASYKELLNQSEIEQSVMPVMLRSSKWEEIWHKVSSIITAHIKGLLR